MPDSPILTPEHEADLRAWVARHPAPHNRLLTITPTEMTQILDSHKALRAKLADAEEENATLRDRIVHRVKFGGQDAERGLPWECLGCGEKGRYSDRGIRHERDHDDA
jgi:hypothetical protein